MTPDEIKIDIESAACVLRNGGVILYPTDTIWGIGCDATNCKAVDRIFKLKKRSDSKAMISLVDSFMSLEKWVTFIPEEAKKEIRDCRCPISVIYDSPIGICNALRAEDGSAAFRIPDLEFTRELCSILGRPIVSTSVNISGCPSLVSFDEIDCSFFKSVDYVCRFGRDVVPKKTPSRIVKVNNAGIVTVIRP